MENSFPKPLSYLIKNLASFSKQSVRLTPDRYDNIRPSDTIRVKLPQNALCDLRGLVMYYEGIGDANCHFPRLSASIIKNVSWFVNGSLIERISDYNILFNKMYDVDGGGCDQTAKRFLENADPSIYYETGTTTSSFNTGIVKLTATSDAVKRKYAITQWLGFCSTLSCPIIDTADLGEVVLELTLDSGNIMWQKQARLQVAAPGFTLSDVHFMIPKIVFNSSDYYNMKAAKLLSSGLTIGYQTFITSKGSLANKSASLNTFTSINSTSLDALIGTFIVEDQTTSNLLLHTHWYSAASVLDTPKPFQNVISLDTIGTEAAGGINAGAYYNQSRYFRSDACGLTSLSFEINNVQLNPLPLADYEIYNETLIALGNAHIDQSAGVHEGLRSLAYFLKYYFVSIQSLEMIQNDAFYRSGLNGMNSSLNIVMKASFGANTSDKVTPYIFAKTTRILQINEGHSITVIV